MLELVDLFSIWNNLRADTASSLSYLVPNDSLTAHGVLLLAKSGLLPDLDEREIKDK
jgi:hypothetical protein